MEFRKLREEPISQRAPSLAPDARRAGQDRIAPPAPARPARARGHRPRPRRPRRRAPRRLRRLRQRRPPGRRRARRGHQGEAQLRRGARRRAAAAQPRPRPRPLRPRRRALPRRALAGPALRAAARPQERAGRRRPAPDRRASTASSWSRSSPPSSSGATATSSSTPSARTTTASWPSASTPGAAGTGSSTRRTACSPRSATTPPATRSATGPIDQGIPAYDRRAERGVLRNLAVREGRRTGQVQTRLVTSAADFAKPPVDLHTVVEGPEQRHRRPHRARSAPSTWRRSCAASASGSRTAPSSRPTPRWPSASTAIAAEAAGLSGTERLFDLFCGIGTMSLAMAPERGRGLGHRGRARGDRRRRGERRASTGSRTPASAPATPAPAIRPLIEEAGEARRRRRRPAARRPLGEDRPAPDRVRGEAHRLRLLQPDHARPERGPARGGRL